MDIDWSDVASFSAAALSAVAAVGSWMAARRSNRTAQTVASIERDRWHAELTPIFEATIQSEEGDRATLDLQLLGPLQLRHLDSVEVAITSSDDADRTSRTTGGPTEEQINAHVWGPYRFTHGADGADEHGHAVAPFPLRVGRGRPFSIERTRPPAWQEGHDRAERWWDQWRGKPLKLVITCHRHDTDPWVVPVDIERPMGGHALIG
jgi:hypothetical protein